MCFLPPQCLFCQHYDMNAGHDDPDCKAFDEIPDEIFRSRFDHNQPYPGDKGVTFLLNPEMREELEEINELRIEMKLEPFPIG